MTGSNAGDSRSLSTGTTGSPGMRLISLLDDSDDSIPTPTGVERIDHGTTLYCRSYVAGFDNKTRKALCILPLGHEPPHDYRPPEEAHDIRGSAPAPQLVPDRRCRMTTFRFWDLPGIGRKKAIFRCAYDIHEEGEHLYPVFPEPDPVLSR